MSLQLRMAGRGAVVRRRPAGDPGLFGDILGGIGKVAGGLITGGPLGAVSAAASLITKKSGGGSATPTGTARPGTGLVGGQLPGLPIPGTRMQLQSPFVGYQGPGPSPATSPAMASTQLACPSGYHPNKHDYFLRDGTFVAAGTKCVRNRRRNPLNPRALSRALSRTDSARKAVKRLKIAPATRRRR